MNEDELQEYIGRRIDILDPDAVIPALETVHKNSGIPLVLVHSAARALAYGHNAGMMRASLGGGVTMAASRFRSGDDINPRVYAQTAAMAPKAAAVTFLPADAAAARRAHLLRALQGSEPCDQSRCCGSG